jgi:acetyl esterase
MSLHPEITKALSTLPVTPPLLDPAALRAAEELQVAPVQERLPLETVEDAFADDVPVRIYTPADAKGLLVYFHGGAFFLGSLDTHDHVARALAKETGRRVVAVSYRRAPEAAYPAGLQDCYTAVRWAAEHYGPPALAGDSSGGNFVAAVAAMAHDDGFDHITHQVLFYPSLDLDFDADRYPSLRENAEGYGLETAGLKPFNAFYLASGAKPDDPLVSPIKRADLTGLPPALILTAEYDPLRDEGELYGRRLRDARVEATVTRYAGANHGFLVNFLGLFPEAFREVAEFLR